MGPVLVFDLIVFFSSKLSIVVLISVPHINGTWDPVLGLVLQNNKILLQFLEQVPKSRPGSGLVVTNWNRNQ